MTMFSEHLAEDCDYRLDMECPSCGKNTAISEAMDGETYNCKECDVSLVAVGYEDMIMRFHVESEYNDDDSDPDETPLGSIW